VRRLKVVLHQIQDHSPGVKVPAVAESDAPMTTTPRRSSLRHVVPRRLGGCDSADCVVPLCRAHHRSYDAGLLALAPYLAPKVERELRHALTHVGCGELEAALEERLGQGRAKARAFPEERPELVEAIRAEVGRTNAG
jgi:hypothetical protein